jgi:BirA family biotin operon repressor/biotin-[acetyl-CoA-carboxylase] ligase
MKNYNIGMFKIEHYYEVDSTQPIAKEFATKGADEGLIIMATKQKSGYGRIKRVWSSNIGGLFASIILRPKIHPKDASKLALLSGIALNITLCEYKVDSNIKWPNDLIVNNKKIAGVLIEMAAQSDRVDWIVVGIGMNINNELPSDLCDIAITLKNVLKKDINSFEFLTILLRNFEKLYISFKKEGFSQFVDLYNSKIAYKNERVKINTNDEINSSVICGTNIGIDEDGMIVIDTGNGFEKLISGTLRKL